MRFKYKIHVGECVFHMYIKIVFFQYLHVYNSPNISVFIIVIQCMYNIKMMINKMGIIKFYIRE